jgi:hypothetical protein
MAAPGVRRQRQDATDGIRGDRLRREASAQQVGHQLYDFEVESVKREGGERVYKIAA